MKKIILILLLLFINSCSKYTPKYHIHYLITFNNGDTRELCNQYINGEPFLTYTGNIDINSISKYNYVRSLDIISKQKIQ